MLNDSSAETIYNYPHNTMKHTLLSGPPGSGKTTAILQEFSDNSIIIVPTLEHASRVRDLLLFKYRPGGFLGIEKQIVTFDKLARSGLTERGVILPDIVTELKKIVLLKEVLETCSLSYFSEVRHLQGFVRKLMELIAELKRTNVYPDDLRKIYQQAGPALSFKEREKLSELTIIYEGYQKLLAEKTLLDDQDLIPMFIELVSSSLTSSPVTSIPLSDRGGALAPIIFIDGFYEFTPAQEALISTLSKTSQLTVTLPWRDDASHNRAFRSVYSARAFLVGLGFEEKYLEACRRTENLSLQTITSQLFRKRSDTCTASAIQKIVGENLSDQLRQIAKAIKKNVQTEACRFCDIALIFRNIGELQPLLFSCFGELQIPLKIHEGRPLMQSAFMQFVVNLLSLMVGSGDIDSLMAFISSAYSTVPAELAWQIRPKLEEVRWSGSLSALSLEELPPELEKLIETSKLLAATLSAKELNLIVLDLLKSVVSQEEILGRSDSTSLVVFKKLQSLLSELQALDEFQYGGNMDFNTYLGFLADALENSLYTTDDLNTNQVQVYDCQLMQQKEYKIVFVCNLEEGVFPQKVSEDIFFKDSERALFNASGEYNFKLELDGAYKEQLLFWLATTRATDKLYLCTYQFDEKGRKIPQSYYLKQVEDLFEREGLPLVVQDEQNFASEEELLAYVLKNHLSLQHPFSSPSGGQLHAHLFNYLLQKHTARLKYLWQKTFWHKPIDVLSPSIASLLNERRKAYSATSLQSYVSCPYQFFASYCLKIEPRETGLTAADRGQLIHNVLELFLTKYLSAEQAINKNSLPELEQIFLAKFKNYRQKLYPQYLAYTAEQSLWEMLKTFLELEIKYQEASAFRPFELEKSFEFELPGHGVSPLKLRGKIDRLDVFNNQAMVIDYKTGSIKFNLEDVYKGHSLQLPIYAMAIMEEKKYQLTACELFSLKDNKRQGMYIKGKGLAELNYLSSRQRLLELEEFSSLLDTVKGHLQNVVADLESGKITRTPKDNECDPYCAYKNVCRVDKWGLVKGA